MKLSKVSVFLFLSLFCITVTAFGKSTILTTWQSTYPDSTSDSIGCQLCHKNPDGGEPWNAYGWAVRQNGGLGESDVPGALAATESLDSDSDPTGSTNLEEINANTQPGWTEGANNTIYYSDSQNTGQTPPSASNLDPADECTYDITPLSRSFTLAGGTGTINITAPDGCEWTAESNDEWITITGGDVGSGNGVVTYTVAVVTETATMTGTITVAGETHTVVQSDVEVPSKQPDLKINTINSPARAKKGKKINVKATIKNAGDAKSPASTVSFYLSENNSKSIDGDTQLGSKNVKALKKKKSSLVKYKWKVSKTLENGKYYLKAFADSNEEVSESNENNNIGVSKKVKVK